MVNYRIAILLPVVRCSALFFTNAESPPQRFSLQGHVQSLLLFKVNFSDPRFVALGSASVGLSAKAVSVLRSTNFWWIFINNWISFWRGGSRLLFTTFSLWGGGPWPIDGGLRVDSTRGFLFSRRAGSSGSKAILSWFLSSRPEAT